MADPSSTLNGDSPLLFGRGIVFFHGILDCWVQPPDGTRTILGGFHHVVGQRAERGGNGEDRVECILVDGGGWCVGEDGVALGE